MSSFGIYQQGDSLAHKLDPRVKVTLAVILILAGFLTSGWYGLALVALLSLCMVLASGNGIAYILKSLRPFLPLMVFIGVFDAVFVSSGDVWWSWGAMALSSGGLLMAADSLLRFSCILVGTSVLMRIATPTELSDAARLMLAPFEKLGVRMAPLSLAFGMTLRFIPMFFEELAKIREAQIGRHGRFDQGGIVSRVASQVPLVVPLFAGAFRRSKTISYAVANRGFGVEGVKRSSYREYRMGSRDAVVMAVGVLFLAGCVALSFLA